MTFVRALAGPPWPVRRWAALGLVLALAVMWPREAGAQLRTIFLNTGYDQAQSQLIPVGGQDHEWRVLVDPTNPPPQPPPATGRPADVVTDSVWIGFNPSLAANFPNSRWISINPNRAPAVTPPTVYQYVFYFTLPVGFSAPQLMLKLSADDHVVGVDLNGNSLFSGSGGIFVNAPLVVSSNTLAHFNSGSSVNVLTVSVGDTAAGITGLIVDGTVTYVDCDRVPVSRIPDLDKIKFWESTFAAPIAFTFDWSDPMLFARRLGPLSATNKDFEGAPGEYYDVFYSNWDGAPNPLGAFITIEAAWDVRAPSGGGLNIARVDLTFFNKPPEFATSVVSFVALGDNAMPNDVGKAVDVDPLASTDTTMGNTNGQSGRLRITLGFACSCVAPPSGLVAWWPLDEVNANGEYEDLAGGDNPGTPIGNPAQIVNAYVGNALQASTNAYVEVADAPGLNFGTGSFSIDAWVRFAASTQTEPIVYKLASPGGGGGYFLYLGNSTFGGPADRLYLHVGSQTFSGPQVSVPNGTWIFVAARVDKTSATAGTVSLYVGVPNSPLAVASSPIGAMSASSPGRSLLIGHQLANPKASIGIDEVELFNVALPPPVIEAIYNARADGKCKCIHSSQSVDLTAVRSATGGVFGVGSGVAATVPGPLAINYSIQGCFGQELFLLAVGAPVGLPPSFYDGARARWVPLDLLAPLSVITPFITGGPATSDGTHTLFSGPLPSGTYDLYLVCDLFGNGHLDLTSPPVCLSGASDRLPLTVP